MTHEFKVNVKKGEKVRHVMIKMCRILREHEEKMAKEAGDNDYRKEDSKYNDHTKFTLRQEGVLLLCAVKKLSDYNIQNLSYIIIDEE